MEIITKFGHIRIMVQSTVSLETVFNLVQQKLVATGLINEVMAIYFQNSFFKNGPNRYEAIYEWIDCFLLDRGAIPDFIRFYDGALDVWLPYKTTAVSTKALPRAVRTKTLI